MKDIVLQETGTELF